PLPLPSHLVNGVTPLPQIWQRTKTPRRSMPEELAWFIRRGDSFLYLTHDADTAAKASEHTYPKPLHRGSVDLIRLNGTEEAPDDTFVFESLWYGRSSFVVNSSDRAERILKRFIELLHERRTTRARVSQSAHIVWDINHPIPEELRDDLLRLAESAGLSLMESA
ncbi:MAG: hypothetical protein AAF492_28670, partial [Verrucomicrobiota bacterium]